MFVVLIDTSQLNYSRSFRGNRSTNDSNQRRMMSTIVELSPEQAQPSTKNCDFDQEEERTSLSPLAQGKFI